ncbi:MAG: rhodanese-like domain-containing protein [Ginsengibacter sp.]|jgi:hypothetical protein
MISLKHIFPAFFISLFILASNSSQGQQVNNWTKDQLMAPSLLAKNLKENKKLPLILSVGPMALIPHSIDLGAASEPESLAKLKNTLSKLPANTGIVIYCGCCPFEKCPNIRPAVDLLKKMNFTNFHLLNLSTSIKADWIDKGYPTVD